MGFSRRPTLYGRSLLLCSLADVRKSDEKGWAEVIERGYA